MSVPGSSDPALQVDHVPGGDAIVAVGSVGVRGTGTTGIVGASNSPNGSGVLGEDLTFSSVGRGVEGISHVGWGVYAVSSGQALRVDGRATFNRAGKVSIPFPQKTATVTGVRLSTSSSFPERPSLVLATCQQHVPGVWVVAVVPDPPNDSFTIVLSRPPGTKAKPRSVAVGWFVVN